jgi:hypothetical protein
VKTTRDEIVAQWSGMQDECGLSVDWSEAHERCWRCGYRSALERCHIVPRALEGSEEPGNLVLLCRRCHREAPNVSDASFMWAWLRAHATPFYDTYWTQRGLDEFEKIFKRKPFAVFEQAPLVSQEAVMAAVHEQINRTCIHFGEGRLNPSTIAWIVLQVEQALLKDAKV